MQERRIVRPQERRQRRNGKVRMWGLPTRGEGTNVMVMLCETARERIFLLRDDRGQVIGRIVRPRVPDVTGPLAGTVLLSREVPHTEARWTGK